MREKWKNERGSATIEFIAMVPLVLLMMMILWQFLVAGYAVIVTQSATNEAAKVYSLTEDLSKAKEAARKVIDTAGDNLELRDIPPPGGGRDFQLTVYVNMNLIFVPKEFVGTLPKISFSRSMNGRVID